jgi:chromosome segregation ATPase
MGTTKTVTNKDLLEIMHDLMQMTSNGFQRLENRMNRLEGRMDGLESRMDGLENRLAAIEAELKAMQNKLREHDLQLDELTKIVRRLDNNHAAYIQDISDILDRITVLEERAPGITKAELRELQGLLQIVVDWALKAAKTIKVPLHLES